jgi:hypothetical protein
VFGPFLPLAAPPLPPPPLLLLLTPVLRLASHWPLTSVLCCVEGAVVVLSNSDRRSNSSSSSLNLSLLQSVVRRHRTQPTRSFAIHFVERATGCSGQISCSILYHTSVLCPDRHCRFARTFTRTVDSAALFLSVHRLLSTCSLCCRQSTHHHHHRHHYHRHCSTRLDFTSFLR